MGIGNFFKKGEDQKTKDPKKGLQRKQDAVKPVQQVSESSKAKNVKTNLKAKEIGPQKKRDLRIFFLIAGIALLGVFVYKQLMNGVFNLNSDASTVFTFVLLASLILLLILKKLLIKNADEKSKPIPQPSQKPEKKSVVNLSFFKWKKEAVPADKKVVSSGEKKVEKIEEKTLNKDKIKGQPKTKADAFDREIVEKKKKMLNVVMIFLVAMGVVFLIIAWFMPGILLKIMAVLVIILPLGILMKVNKKQKQTVEKAVAFNVEEYKDLTQLLNKFSELNKEKDDLMKKLGLIENSMGALEEIRLKMLTKEAKVDNVLAAGITVMRKEESQEKHELKKQIVVITPKMIRSKEFETDMDLLLEIVESKNIVKISDAAKFFKTDLKKIESLAKILEEHSLLQIHYPTFGEIELRRVIKKEGMV